MLPQTGGALCLILFLLSAALVIDEVRGKGRVVCYYTNWSVYRPGTAKFNPQNINPYLCTHLIYAFGGFTKDNQMKPFDKYQDIEQGGYAKFTGLKTYNKQLKTMIAIGGWNEASSRFSPLVANSERRQKFIKNILKFLRQNHFDGIDLDWEYPAHREGGKPRDRDNYAQFVQELRTEFEREVEKTGRTRLLLTMAVPAGIQYIEKGYDIPKLNKFLDWFNVLTYDFHSAHEPSVNHHAPLYSLEEESEYNYDAELNIDYSIKFYLEAGASRDKLVLGIPTYGRSFTLINEDSTEIGAPSEGPGEQGDATREKGYLAYYEICQNIKEDPEWTVVQPNPTAMGPYAYRRNQWVGYDDEAIVRKKSQYVVDNGLGGIMFWSIDNDDFRGICSGKPYPLIEAAKEAMLDALGIGINEVSKSNVPQKPNHSTNRESTLSIRNRLILSEEKVPRKRVQTTTTTTTTAPSSTTIKLTEVEGSSLYIGGRTTPPPPTTPDPGTDFKCEDEGFFQHPRDCKKYYWCLDSGPSGLGIVAHQFTCPSGLYFNPSADSCDFARNVPCKIKKTTTTAVPITKSTILTTTLKPSVAPNRITAAPSRISYLRTTPRLTTSTTTTTETPLESQEVENEYAVERNQSQRESEEDPKVIKELIDLIKRVGGIEELEKHLLRKDDGTISIKQPSASSVESTTPSSISKSLYDKVLTRPNAYNTFRNRLTNANILRQSSRTKNSGTSGETILVEDTDSGDSKTTSSYSKYSSVVRGNSRQGPQGESIERLPEFDGFLKEKKQYVTINRNRVVQKTAELEKNVNLDNDDDDDDDENGDENINKRKILIKVGEAVEDTTEIKHVNSVPITTPTYVNIRRTRPSTTTSSSTITLNGADNKQGSKYYTTISRYRNKIPEIEPTDNMEDVTSASSTRYKYLERTRPITTSTESIILEAGRISAAESDFQQRQDDLKDIDDSEDIVNYHQNTVQFKAAKITHKSQQQVQQQEQVTSTLRANANIGRRSTTTPTTATTQTVINTRAEPIFTTELLITRAAPSKFENLTLKPIATTATINGNNPSVTLPIITTTNPILFSSAASTAATTKSITTPVATTTPSFITNRYIAKDFHTNKNLETIDPSLYTNNSLKFDPSLAPSTIASSLDKKDQNANVLLLIDYMTNTEQSETSNILKYHDKITNQNEYNENNEDEDEDEVKLVINNINKTKYSTITRNATANTSIISNDERKTLTSQSNITDRLDSYNVTVPKYSGGRRQSDAQELLSNSSMKQTTTKPTLNRITTPTTTVATTTAIPTNASIQLINNAYLGSVSSPRPFGYPKRRGRPTVSNTTPSATDATPVKINTEDRLSFIQKTNLNAAINSPQNKLHTPSTAAQYNLEISRRPILSVRKRLTNTTTVTMTTTPNLTTISAISAVSSTLNNNHNGTNSSNNNNSNNSNNDNNNTREYLSTFTTTITESTPTPTTTTTATSVASLTYLLDELLTTTSSTATETEKSAATTKLSAAGTATSNFSKYNRLRVIRPLDATSLLSKQYLNNLKHQRKVNSSITDLTLASSSLATASSLNDIIGQRQQTNNNNNNNSNSNKKYRRYQSSSSPSYASSFPTASSSLSALSSSSSSSSTIGTLPTSIVLRRKYQARRLTTTVTPANNVDDTEAPRTTNPLFKRRPTTYKIPKAITTRTKTSSAKAIIESDNHGGLIDNILSIFHNENGSNKNKNHIVFEIAETNDQIAKSSIYRSQFNQLGEPSSISPVQSSTAASSPTSIAASAALVSRAIAAAAAAATTNIDLKKTNNDDDDDDNDDDDNDDDDDDDVDNDNNDDDEMGNITIIISTTPLVEKSTANEQLSQNINALVTSSGLLNGKNQTTFATKKRKIIIGRRQQPIQKQKQQQKQYKEADKNHVNEHTNDVKKKNSYRSSSFNENRGRPSKYQAVNQFRNNNNKIQIIPVIKTVTKAPTLQQISNHPEHDYDYYDDEDVRVVGNKDQQLKVILHGGGIIECLDQGNFPHPLSCRKFISCAKFETGGVVGWEYACPKGLSYDPVGGMCNWAAGLGCKE